MNLDKEKLFKFFQVNRFALILALLGFGVLLVGLVNYPGLLSSRAETFDLTSEEGSIKVDIGGAVNKPGVYSFKENSRVSDALEIAGGLSAEADLNWVEKNLNQAKILEDGEKLYLPKLNEQTSVEGVSSSKISGAFSKISINTANSFELESLPGVGSVTAAKIISGRSYGSLEELKSRKVVGSSTFEKIKDLISL
ncbi:MAG: hypothetical protein A2Y57_03765 [Candidatus Woykebacteria bacterium RBG_13_40_7b]|uniref:Soluble ligand binding domain-containing protein n=1 Tax=Candidatus Woykebacteria bacterium RBG_13_40_7b TaxID=1802594 RepID=A0A1G1W9T9_9BACT|nr:MAG: hypothetical protein A2Y57_03765 [Candidatus Woykebacteria bacterium RBG_13_40_7b]